MVRDHKNWQMPKICPFPCHPTEKRTTAAHAAEPRASKLKNDESVKNGNIGEVAGRVSLVLGNVRLLTQLLVLPPSLRLETLLQ